MKRVMTVCGPVDPEEIGVTMMHEHLLIDQSCNFWALDAASLRGMMHASVSVEMLSLLRRRPLSVTLDNLVLHDEELAAEEVGWYYREGGQTIVDCTNVGIGMDPRALYHISRATGVHIVMGGGCYTENSHPPWVSDATLEDLTERFIRDVTIGVDQSGIRSGILGEIGTSGLQKGSTQKEGDITPEEEKVLRAAGRASVKTGVAVTLHIDLRGRGAFRVIDILEDEGVPVDRIVIGHMDLVKDLDYNREVARRGVWVEYDSLGREHYSEELGGHCLGHDTWKVEHLAALVKDGFADQLVLSQDVSFKMDLRRYGGNGYAHILTWIVPMLGRAGVAEEDIRKMLVENPRRILTVDWDEEMLSRSAPSQNRIEQFAA